METATPFKIEHNGVTITYDEPRNLFCFELRGRQRTAESLAKAREAIDKPVKEKAKPFERFKAWKRDSISWGTSDYVEVEVTSIAEATYDEASEVWVNNTPGSFRSREKIQASSVFPRNERNDAVVAEWKERQGRIKALETEQKATVKKLKSYEIPKE